MERLIHWLYNRPIKERKATLERVGYSGWQMYRDLFPRLFKLGQIFLVICCVGASGAAAVAFVLGMVKLFMLGHWIIGAILVVCGLTVVFYLVDEHG